MRTILHNFRIVDENTDLRGAVVVEDGFIRDVLPWDAGFPGSARGGKPPDDEWPEADVFIDGGGLLGAGMAGSFPVLMPALVDLHAHFRDPGVPDAGSGVPSGNWFPSETVESAALAAVAGGYGTAVCMANTKPPVDTPEKAQVLRDRCKALGLIDLYPALSLTKNMEGRELSGFTGLNPDDPASCCRILSEDGKDVADDAVFLAAMREARRLGLPVSCHCDAGGPEAEAARAAGKGRTVWSRIEENNAVRRAIELGQKAGCHIHIAHVSTRESAELIRRAKKSLAGKARKGAFFLSCEATPHHIACTEADAHLLGEEGRGRVNPPLREEADRRAIIEALRDGTIDAIATDHAPHSGPDKDRGAPGFTGLETAFSVCLGELVLGRSGSGGVLDLRRLSSLMSAAPARILGLGGNGPLGRGRIAPGLRADFLVADTGAPWKLEPALLKSRGKNSPFAGRELGGKILMTFHGGRIVFGGTDG